MSYSPVRVSYRLLTIQTYTYDHPVGSYAKEYRTFNHHHAAHAATVASTQEVIERSRSRSPMYAGRHLYAHPAPVHVMAPPVHREVVEIKKVSGHVDYFVAELQAEVNELRARQRDYLALQEQFRFLNEDYNRVLVDK